MTEKRIDQILLGTTILTLTVSVVALAIFCGYYQTSVKFKTMLVTMCLVLLVHHMLIDPIKLAFQTIGAACWPPHGNKFPTDREATHRNRLHYLKFQLRSLRSQLWITEEHRDEWNNCRLKLTLTDLIVYGKYLFMFAYIMLHLRDAHEYYVAHSIRHLLNRNDSLYNGLKEVRYICDAYDFIQTSFIDAFSPAPDRHDLLKWAHGEQTVLVGVLRLRQLRLTERHYGVKDASFSKEKHLPEWKLPYRQDPYMNSYSRIYNPWLPWMETDSIKIPLIESNAGIYRRYFDSEGYVTYLARTRQNSLTILNFLREYKWLDYNTSALFLDFSLFNADTNVVIICTIRLEQTPFGSIVPDVDIVSLQLLGTLYTMDTFKVVLLFLYALVSMQFYKGLILRLWFDPKEIHDMWNKVDLIILLLNVLLLVLFLIRTSVFESILEDIENESKMRYIDTRIMVKLHSFIKLVMGLLIALATIRLWKVLQFSPTIQMFNHTLLISWRAVVNMAVAICVFIMGCALYVSITKGNNRYNLNRFGRSIVASTLCAFGFSKYNRSHDADDFGIVYNAFLILLICALFLNIIVCLINHNFTIIKTQADPHTVHGIGILEFWRAEYHYVFQWFQKYRIFRSTYSSLGKTVMENINYEMAKFKKIQRSLQVNHLLIKLEITKTESKMEHSKFKQIREQIYTLGAIMNTQIDILERYLQADKNGNLLEEYSKYDKNK